MQSESFTAVAGRKVRECSCGGVLFFSGSWGQEAVKDAARGPPGVGRVSERPLTLVVLLPVSLECVGRTFL